MEWRGKEKWSIEPTRQGIKWWWAFPPSQKYLYFAETIRHADAPIFLLDLVALPCLFLVCVGTHLAIPYVGIFANKKADRHRGWCPAVFFFVFVVEGDEHGWVGELSTFMIIHTPHLFMFVSTWCGFLLPCYLFLFFGGLATFSHVCFPSAENRLGSLSKRNKGANEIKCKEHRND